MLQYFGGHVERRSAEGLGQGGAFQMTGEAKVGYFEMKLGRGVVVALAVGFVAFQATGIVQFVQRQRAGEQQILGFDVSMDQVLAPNKFQSARQILHESPHKPFRQPSRSPAADQLLQIPSPAILQQQINMPLRLDHRMPQSHDVLVPKRPQNGNLRLQVFQHLLGQLVRRDGLHRHHVGGILRPAAPKHGREGARSEPRVQDVAADDFGRTRDAPGGAGDRHPGRGGRGGRRWIVFARDARHETRDARRETWRR
mmetsp:Transcript_35867/g.83628  ORF Transcript_35867/g.83628 Transcript_35867/m.83628 type:complete len:255 (+) Transcript_35867:2138-2902(+)